MQLRECRLIWHWSESGTYSASSVYAVMFTRQTQILGAKELCKVTATNKCLLFFWLVLHDKNWTSERAWHHGLRDDALRVLYDQEVETIDHLLTTCP
jgi:hypothetical protein